MGKLVSLASGLFLVILIVSLTSNVSASHNSSSNDNRIPEVSGTYDDPGHPGVKVRVFVHGEKPAQTESSLLICNLSDPDSVATVSATPWHLPSNWTYNLNPSSVPPSVGSANLATIAGNAFSDWATASGTLSFNPGSTTSINRNAYDGKNIVAFGRTSRSSLGVTYVRYFTSSGLVVDVDTVLNSKVPWSWANSDSCAYDTAYDAEAILTHELGHWIGMDDEYNASAFRYATMFGYGNKGEVHQNTLSTGDINGAYSIYNP